MIEYKEKRKRVFYKGVELASFYAEYPSVDEFKFVGEFYENMVMRCFEWFCEKYCKDVLEKYLSNEDPQKRFRTSVGRYSIKFKAGFFDGELLSVRCDVILRKSQTDLVYEYHGAENFALLQGIMISPKSVLRKAYSQPSKSRKSLVKGRPVYIDPNKDVFYFDSGEWKRIE